MPGNSVAKFIKLWFVPSVHIMLVHRIGHAIIKLWPPFSWILLIPYGFVQFVIKVVYVAIIPAKTEIGPGCVILHTYGVHLHPMAKLGKNVTIAEQVGIGAAKLSDTQFPVIGDDVYLGIGCKIMGNLKINNGTVVGANAVVLKNMPAYCVVGGVPAKVLKRIPKAKKKPFNKNFNKDKPRPNRNYSPKNETARIKRDRRKGVIHV